LNTGRRARYLRADPKEAVTERRQSTQEQEPPTTPRPIAGDSLFREVNDRILELGERFGFHEEPLELICECEDGSCTERVSISADEFAELRAEDGLHLVAEGHSRSGRMVRRRAGYIVVGD
jgi:hypothetical protein